MQAVLVAILTVLIMIERVNSSEVNPISADSDEENNLRQALFLVKLLKADYLKSLPSKDELQANLVDDEANSTCPDEDFNTTTSILYSVPVSAQPSMINPSSLAPKLDNPKLQVGVAAIERAVPAYIAPPAATIATREQIQNNPPSPTQTRPAEYMAPVQHFNYPYSFHARRMMPSYDYYDDPLLRFGGRRRIGGENVKPIEPPPNLGGYRRTGDENTKLIEPPSNLGGYRRAGEANARNIEPPMNLGGYRKIGNENVKQIGPPPKLGNYRRFDYMSQPIYQNDDRALYERDYPMSGFDEYRRFGYINRPQSLGRMHKKGDYNPEIDRFSNPFLETGYRRVGDGDTQTSGTVVTETSGADITQVSETTGTSLTGDLALHTNETAATDIPGVSDGGPSNVEDIRSSVTVPNKTQSFSTEPASTTAVTSLMQATLSALPKKKATVPTALISLKILNRSTDRANNVNTLQAFGKAPKADLRKDVQQIKKNNIARQKNTSDKSSEDHVLSEVASELMNEVKQSEINTRPAMPQQPIDTLPEKERPASHKSTMKIFLKGSSRMHIPFSENNAFCHLYPHNKLCSSGL